MLQPIGTALGIPEGHFILATYDEVFEVICAGYVLTLEDPVTHLLAEDEI